MQDPIEPQSGLQPCDEDPPASDDDSALFTGGPFPWDEEPEGQGAGAQDARARHDAFTEAKKSVFLRALVKTGGILDACRLTGIAARTVYRHQQDDQRFFGHCCLALRISATPVELTAWERAVDGVQEEYAVGGRVMRRTRYSDGLLRLLLQASNPRKFGPRPGFKRKRLLKFERKQMEREIRAEIDEEERRNGKSFEDAVESVLTKIAAIERHEEPKKRAAGWTKSPDGHWVPPGYAPVPGWTPPEPPAEADDAWGDASAREETSRDSL